MAAPSTTREKLLEKISELSEEELEDLLDYLNLLSDPDELTPDELEAIDASLEELARGEVTTLEEFERGIPAE